MTLIIVATSNVEKITSVSKFWHDFMEIDLCWLHKGMVNQMVKVYISWYVRLKWTTSTLFKSWTGMTLAKLWQNCTLWAWVQFLFFPRSLDFKRLYIIGVQLLFFSPDRRTFKILSVKCNPTHRKCSLRTLGILWPLDRSYLVRIYWLKTLAGYNISTIWIWDGLFMLNMTTVILMYPNVH